MVIRTLLALMLIALLASAPLAAQDSADATGTTTREVVDERLAELKTELDLTDYQWSQVEMTLKSSIRERLAIIRRYDLEDSAAREEPLNGSEKRAAKRELKNSQEDLEKRMKRYLDKEQYKSFKDSQEVLYEAIEELIDQS